MSVSQHPDKQERDLFNGKKNKSAGHPQTARPFTTYRNPAVFAYGSAVYQP